MPKVWIQFSSIYSFCFEKYVSECFCAVYFGVPSSAGNFGRCRVLGVVRVEGRVEQSENFSATVS